MNQTVTVELANTDELAVARWASQWLDGYLENMQDDQSLCYECGIDQEEHQDDSHFYDGNWPEFRTEIRDALTTSWTIALHPRMIIEHLLCNVLEDFEKMESTDWDVAFAKPEPEVATILRCKIRLAMKAIGEPIPEV